MNNKEKIRITQKRVLKNDEVWKILNNISKYFYLSKFEINIKNRIDKDNRMIISYTCRGEKNSENIQIADNFII